MRYCQIEIGVIVLQVLSELQNRYRKYEFGLFLHIVHLNSSVLTTILLELDYIILNVMKHVLINAVMIGITILMLMDGLLTDQSMFHVVRIS